MIIYYVNQLLAFLRICPVIIFPLRLRLRMVYICVLATLCNVICCKSPINIKRVFRYGYIFDARGIGEGIKKEL